MRSPLITQEAVPGTYEDSVYTDCYFVREETVYVADSAGTVYNHYSDGARVAKDSLISTVYTENVSEDVLRELNTIDKKLEDIRNSDTYIGSLSDDETNVENRIDSLKNSIIDAAVDNDIRGIVRYKDTINGLRNGTSGPYAGDTVETLNAQKTAAEAKIGGQKQEIYAETSGVFLTVLDGMEHILTPQNAMTMTVRDFNAIVPVSEKTSNQTVNAGDSICKIVNNHKWYVVCCIASERLADRPVGTEVKMRFDNIVGVDADGKIVYISEPQDGKNLILIESNQFVEGAYTTRKSGMELIFSSYDGYLVPINAVRTDENGQRCILVRKNNVDRLYPCDIIYTNDAAEYVIIKTPDDASLKLEDADEFVLGER